MRELLCLSLLGSVFTLLLAGLKGRLLRRCGGRWYRIIWLLVLVAYTVPYKIGWLEVPAGISVTSPVEETGWQALDVLAEPVGTAVPMPDAAFPAGISAGGILRAVYFAGLVLMLLHYAAAYALFCRRLEAESREIKSGEERACFSSICGEMGIRREILLMKSSFTATPMLTGMIRPRVILPERVFSEQELRMVFRHELTHYKEKDLIYKAAALAVRTMHWFNPLAGLMLRNINEACEYSCDEAVAKGLDVEGKQEYGHMLLNQVQSGCKREAFFVGLKGKGRQREILERRIGVIMNKKRYQWAGVTILLVLGLAAGADSMGFRPVYAKRYALPTQTEGRPAGETPGPPETYTAAAALRVNDENDAIRIVAEGIGRLFGGEADLEAWAEFNDGTTGSIQPEGCWFIRLSDASGQEYAAWLAPETGSLRIRSGIKTEALDSAARERIRQDGAWLERAEALIKEGDFEKREIVDTLFLNLDKPEQQTADIKLSLEDGTYYVISFRGTDGALKQVQYIAGEEV